MIEKILLIEDDTFFAKQMLRALRRHFPDFRFDWVQTVKEAEETMARHKYDLIISDLLLPDSMGEHIQTLAKRGHKDLVLSAGSDEIIKNEMLHLNIVDFILKGIDSDFDYLIRIIKRLKANADKRILVVEDSDVIRKFYKKMLESQFLKVSTARNGKEGLEKLKEEAVDLVVSDYTMPEMDGLQMLEAIRKIYSMVEMPFIVVSSDEENQTVALFLKMGANDYLKKPFSKEEMLCRINNMLDTLDMVRELKHSAVTDALTGLPNRRYLYEIAPRLMKIAGRYEDQPLSILMLDIDYFKRFNDKYGHQTGDLVLKKVAQIIRLTLRKSDIPIRFGGEEFLVMMPHTDLKRAFVVAEKLRRKVAETEVVTPEGERLHVTVSGGVAQYHKNMSLDELIKKADEALYKAKAAGRNRIEIANRAG